MKKTIYLSTQEKLALRSLIDRVLESLGKGPMDVIIRGILIHISLKLAEK